MAVGRLILVGAGPGDPDLITVKGLKALQAADVVLFDRLIGKELLQHCHAGAVLIDVGKTPGDDQQSAQERIHRLIQVHGESGATVVRLKGGDSFVFGRGAEEAIVALRLGMKVEVIPGISSALAAPAVGGISITHREFSNAFGVFTAHEADEKDTIPWSAAAEIPTRIFLMGVERIGAIVENLLQHGVPANEPLCVIYRGTEVNQRLTKATLGTILGFRDELKSPSVIVVGKVAEGYENWI